MLICYSRDKKWIQPSNIVLLIFVFFNPHPWLLTALLHRHTSYVPHMFFSLNEFLQNACNGITCTCINHVHQTVFYLFHLLTAQYAAFDIGSGGCVLPANHSMGCIHPPQLIRPFLTDRHAVCLQSDKPYQSLCYRRPPHTYPLRELCKFLWGIHSQEQEYWLTDMCKLNSTKYSHGFQSSYSKMSCGYRLLWTHNHGNT